MLSVTQRPHDRRAILLSPKRGMLWPLSSPHQAWSHLPGGVAVRVSWCLWPRGPSTHRHGRAEERHRDPCPALCQEGPGEPSLHPRAGWPYSHQTMGSKTTFTGKARFLSTFLGDPFFPSFPVVWYVICSALLWVELCPHSYVGSTIPGSQRVAITWIWGR